MVKCKDCLCYYPKDYSHICPQWIKELVKQYNDLKAVREIAAIDKQTEILRAPTDYSLL